MKSELQDRELKLIKFQQPIRTVHNTITVRCRYGHENTLKFADLKWSRRHFSHCPTCDNEYRKELEVVAWVCEINFHLDRLGLEIINELPHELRPVSRFEVRCLKCHSAQHRKRNLRLLRIASKGCLNCIKEAASMALSVTEEQLDARGRIGGLTRLSEFGDGARATTNFWWCCNHCLFIFERSYAGLRSSSKCPFCLTKPLPKLFKLNNRIKDPLILHEIYSYEASVRGGQLRSSKYLGYSKKLKWECKAGHEFPLSPSGFQNQQWCTFCDKGFWLGQELVRLCFEQMFGKEFEECSPDWLPNPERKRLSLDGYCEQLKLAFEHQGRQHKKPWYRDRDRSDWKKREWYDEIKRVSCKKNFITLIEVDDVPNTVNADDLAAYVEAKLPNRLRSLVLTKDIDYSKLFNHTRMELIEKIIIDQGGKLIKTPKAIGAFTELEVFCGTAGHDHFYPKVRDIEGRIKQKGKGKRSSWCYDCARENQGLRRRAKKYNEMVNGLKEMSVSIVTPQSEYGGKESTITLKCKKHGEFNRVAVVVSRNLNKKLSPCDECR